MTLEALEAAGIRRRVTLFCGHYGSGKTTLAVACALALRQAGKRVRLYDLDVVNPYFRAADTGGARLADAGVPLVVSPYAATNVDMPALPAEMYRMLCDSEEHAVVDVGGDDRGALALGRVAPGLTAENDYDMLLIFNPFRPLTAAPEDAYRVAREIEAASGLSFTKVLLNANLGGDTKASDVLAAYPKALELAGMLAIPMAAVCARERLRGALAGKLRNLLFFD